MPGKAMDPSVSFDAARMNCYWVDKTLGVVLWRITLIKGLYAAASAMIAGIRKQNLKAHNIANLDTPGFKQVFTTIEEYQRTDVYSSTSTLAPAVTQRVGSIGLGVTTTDMRTKFSPGALLATGQLLDLAIQGDGFFRILTPEGERYTRDGRFQMNSENQVVTVDGNFVLDESGSPILLPAGEISVERSGTIRAGEDLVARFGIVEFPDTSAQLQRGDGNYFQASGEMRTETVNSVLLQGYLEQSNVSAVDMMIGFGTYEAAQVLVQTQDELLGKTISIVGKVA